MGALGISQEKNVGNDVEQSKNKSENIDFDCRIFELKVLQLHQSFHKEQVKKFKKY